MRTFCTYVTKPVFGGHIDDYEYSIYLKRGIKLLGTLEGIGIFEIIKLRDALNKYLHQPDPANERYLYIYSNSNLPLDENDEYCLFQQERTIFNLHFHGSVSGSLQDLSENEVIALSEELTQIINVYEQGGEL